MESSLKELEAYHLARAREIQVENYVNSQSYLT